MFAFGVMLTPTQEVYMHLFQSEYHLLGSDLSDTL